MTADELGPKGPTAGWHFIDDQGTFELHDPHLSSYLYFPLVNEAGIFSAITPTFHGDIKTGHNSFLTLPVSVEDLHNSRSARSFWVFIEDLGPWCVTGNSAAQSILRYDTSRSQDAESTHLEAGFLWHRITRSNTRLRMHAEITNFIPECTDRLELMKVVLTNTADHVLRLVPTAAVPIYARSAENLRDHRHVTSLLNRITCSTNGIIVTPTLSFDERGHLPNSISYAVLGVDGSGLAPTGFFPLVEDFIGEGGTLDWPEVVIKNLPASHHAGDSYEGYEAMGALRFAPVNLEPGQTTSYVLVLAILDPSHPSTHPTNGIFTPDPEYLLNTYAIQFDAWLDRTRQKWNDRLNGLQIHTGDQRFDLWLRWVAIQPTLRRFFGNSFLPYHDYGRGGRGWRDLWQDILALLIIEPSSLESIRESLLIGNFAGVRLDGSNATIIGSQPGEFKADRNNIPRVWMDHGAWPLLTTRLYIDQTGDLAFLLRQQAYFKDHLICRSQAIDEQWQPDQGTQQRTITGDVYQGTILEHLLIQHLVAFFNVGEHNNIRLEGADWNDGMDMARRQGESVAFTAFYAWNLRQLSELILAMESMGIQQISLAKEILVLLDQLDKAQSDTIDYASPSAKQNRLAAYFDSVRHCLSGEQANVNLPALADDLAAKADWLTDHLRAQEWITNREGYSWFNGYYNDDGQRVEGDSPLGPNAGTRMILTGQVFPLMGNIATEPQAHEVIRSVDHYLHDSRVGGYRLNTNFGEVLLNLGRCFGFAFGHKENGAMFSHMAVMYANALYRRRLVHEGYKVISEIYHHCQDFTVSRMYPGLPEYINSKGRGMYPYLTGSASWYLLTLVTEVFGVKGHLGNLVIEPKLVRQQFEGSVGTSHPVSLITQFAGRSIEVTYHNPALLDYGQYCIDQCIINGKQFPIAPAKDSVHPSQVVIPRDVIIETPAVRPYELKIEIILCES
jgi:cellobiose phosphorylase